MTKSRRPRKGETEIIQNLTNKRQSVFDTEGVIGEPGLRYDIEPYDVKTVHKKLASLFWEVRAKYVIKYTPAPIPRKEGEAMVWLANATGNPLLPDEVSIDRVEKGEHVQVMIDNPLKKVHPIHRVMHGGFSIIKTKDGTDKMTWPKPHPVFDFPPFQRLPVSATYARWNIERDQRQLEQYQGQLIECAEPRDFEPNDSWSLTQLQAYVECLGTQELVKAPHLFGDDEESYEDREQLERVKTMLLRALFFILLDDIEVPTETDYDAYLQLFIARKKTQATIQKTSKKEQNLESQRLQV